MSHFTNLAFKDAVTLVTIVWLFSIVHFQMCPQMTCIKGYIVVLVAFVWLFTTVSFQMSLQIASMRGCKVTLIAVVFSCPDESLRELYTYPCHSLSTRTFYFLTSKSDPRDLWPLRRMIIVTMRHNWPKTKTVTKTKTMTNTVRDLWHLRHWLQFWQLWTWFHDNFCCLTIKSDTGQHSQFLWCLEQNEGTKIFFFDEIINQFYKILIK